MRTGRLNRPAAAASLAGLVAATAFGIAAATAPAGNRTPAADVVGFPGPEEVTYGENVAYTATLLNNQKSTFTNVVYTHKIPITYLAGQEEQADLIYASCDNAGLTLGKFTDTHYSCPPRTLAPSATVPATVLLVWKTPAIEEPLTWPITCDATSPPPTLPYNSCTLKSEGQWTMKEGTGKPGSAGPDSFPPTPKAVTTNLLGDDEDPFQARGYILDPSDCLTTFSGGVGPGNRLVTEVCASTVLPGRIDFPFSPGVTMQLDESEDFDLHPDLPEGFERATETAFVCIPEPGDSCPTSPDYGDSAGYTPWSFDDPETTEVVEMATFTFVIDNTTLPPGVKIEEVYHDGVLVPFCDDEPEADPCVVDDIVIDHQLKITIVEVRGSEQGGWDFT